MTLSRGLVVLLVAIPSTVTAKPTWKEDEPVSRRLAVGVTIAEQGFGGLARARFGHVGFEGAGGVKPFVTFAEGCGVEIGLFGHVTASGLFFFDDHRRFFQSGLRAAAFWNGLVGFGGMLGYVGELSITKRLAVQAGAGVQVSPHARKHVTAYLDSRCSEPTALKILDVVAPYFGVNILFYLF